MDYASRRKAMRRLIISSSMLSRALLYGNFRSAFRGRGIDFDSLREYEAGDDAMRIDWNATVRLGRTYVKDYVDERGLPVYLVLDRSSSMAFGKGQTKADTAALTAALLAYACMLHGHKVGAMFFGIPQSPERDYWHRDPASGTHAIRTLIENILVNQVPASGYGTDLAAALDAVSSHLSSKSLIMVFSDFRSASYALPLARLSRKHDVVCVRLKDPSDEKIPGARMLIRACDSETSRRSLVATGMAEAQETRRAFAEAERMTWLSAIAASKVATLELGPEDDPAFHLIRFFDSRTGGHHAS